MKMKPENPRTLADCPAYTAAADKLAALQAQRREVAERVDALVAQYAALPRGKEAVTLAAQRLLDGDSDGDSEAAVTQSLADAKQELAVYDEALRLQGEAVGRERGAASQLICQSYAAEHRLAVDAISTAVRILDAAIKEERGIIDALERGDVLVGSPIVRAHFSTRERWQAAVDQWRSEHKG